MRSRSWLYQLGVSFLVPVDGSLGCFGAPVGGERRTSGLSMRIIISREYFHLSTLCRAMAGLTLLKECP